MLLAVLLLSVSATPPKLGAVRFSVIDLSEERAEFYTEHFADRLSEQGVRVVTPREVATLLGMERQRALMGCDESTSCLVELANALGVDGVVLGTVAKVSNEYQVNLKIIASSNGRRLSTRSLKVSSEGEVIDGLTTSAHAMALELSAALGRPLEARSGPGAWWVIPASVGVLAAAGGAVGLVVAENSRARLASGEPLEPSAAAALFESGKTARTSPCSWPGRRKMSSPSPPSRARAP